MLKGQKGKKSKSGGSSEDSYYYENTYVAPVFKSTHRTRTRGRNKSARKSGSADVDLYLATDGYASPDSNQNYYYHAGPVYPDSSPNTSPDSYDHYPKQYKVKGFKGRSKGGSKGQNSNKQKNKEHVTIDTIQQQIQYQYEHGLQREHQIQAHKHKGKFAKKSLKHRDDPGDRKNSHKESSSKGSRPKGSKGGTRKTCNSRKQKRKKDNRYRGQMARVNRRGFSDSWEHYGKEGYGYAPKSERGKKTKTVSDYVYRTGRWEPISPGNNVERYYYYGDKGSKGKGRSKGKSKGSSKSKSKGSNKGSKGKGGYDDDELYYEDDYYEDDCTGKFILPFS